MVADPTGWGSVLQDHLLQVPVTSGISYPQFCLTWLQIRGFSDPFFRLKNFPGQLTDLRETHLLVHYEGRRKGSEESWAQRYPGPMCARVRAP
jgi:hypothetical protein